MGACGDGCGWGEGDTIGLGSGDATGDGSGKGDGADFADIFFWQVMTTSVDGQRTRPGQRATRSNSHSYSDA